jgi:2-polyprenyl-3-methyl-5-hydroxy-6-metoxy-1,4-benzoquinol methylase
LERIRTENLNTVAQWDRIYGDPLTTRRWTIWRDPPLVLALSACLGHKDRVLHVGCGAGICAEQLSFREDLSWTGCDFSAAAVNYLRSTSTVPWARIEQADLTVGLPFDDHAFDAVICAEVLEHLENPVAALAELRRVARKTLIVTVPNENVCDTQFHLWKFTAADLRSLLSVHGRPFVDQARDGQILFGQCQLWTRQSTTI